MEGNSGQAYGSRVLPATWWKFSEYELSPDGRIRPAEGAAGERYDPWQAFQKARRGRPKRRLDAADAKTASRRRRVELPYQQLISIAHEYASAPEKRGVGRPRQTEATLLGWCAENGLLGLLHHQLIAARFPPAVQERDDFSGMSMVRTASGWSSESIPRRMARTAEGWASESTPRRKPRRMRSGYLASVMPSGTLLRWFPTGELRFDGFDGEWSQYFACDSPLRTPAASLRGSQAAGLGPEDEAQFMGQEAWPPLPGDEAFWREYGEPLPEFVAAGMRLAEAVHLIGLDQQQEPNQHLARVGARDLAELSEPVVPRLAANAEGSWDLSWSSPSLLGSLALMAMGDIAGGARIISCRSCGVTAVIRSETGAYCSSRCRERGPAKTA